MIPKKAPNIVHISTRLCMHRLISKGLPPPPKASGLLLAVCSALLVSTVALPSLTAVLMNAGSIVVDLALEAAKLGFWLVEEVDKECESEEKAVDIDVEVEAELILVLVRRLIVTLDTVVCGRATVVVETVAVGRTEEDECIKVVGFVGSLVDKV